MVLALWVSRSVLDALEKASPIYARLHCQPPSSHPCWIISSDDVPRTSHTRLNHSQSSTRQVHPGAYLLARPWLLSRTQHHHSLSRAVRCGFCLLGGVRRQGILCMCLALLNNSYVRSAAPSRVKIDTFLDDAVRLGHLLDIRCALGVLRSQVGFTLGRLPLRNRRANPLVCYCEQVN